MGRPSMSRKALSWAGFAAGILLIGWILRDLDIARLADVVASAEAWPILPLAVLIFADGAIRAEKWRHMLVPLRAVSWRRLFGAILAGYFANMFTPVRVSPLVRAWLVARLEGLRTASLLATITLDRAVDGVVFLSLAALALASLRFPADTDTVRDGVMWGSAIGVVLLVVVFGLLVALRFGLAHRLAGLVELPLIRRLPSRWRAATRGFVDDFGAGVVWPRAVWRGVVIVVASIVIKLMQISYFLWAGLAFGVVLPLWAYLYLMIFLGFLVILSSTLRIVGGFTAGAVIALGTFGVEMETALAMTLVVQIVAHAVITVVGLPALWLQGLGIRALRARQRQGGFVDEPAA